MRLLLSRTLILIVLAVGLAGCQALDFLTKEGSKEKLREDEYVGWDEKRFHDQAKEALDNKLFSKAAQLYEALESRYPFGDYAPQAQLNVAYAYYKNDDPEGALAAVDRFIKINPRSPSVDYAYYLKGLINYNRGIGFIDRFLPTDSTQRDPGNARDAYDNFQELVKRFPNSKYAADAKQRMIALRNNMAMYELHVADYYMRRKAFVAAVSRANLILKDYQRTPAVPPALQILADAYRKLGMEDMAADADRIYQVNYPNGAPVVNYQDPTIMEQAWDAMGLDK